MKILTHWLCATVAVVGLSLTSCNDNDNSQEIRTTQGFTDCYAAVTDLATGATSYVENCRITLDLDWTNAKADISITGLRTNTNLPVIKISDVSWGVSSESGWMQAKAVMTTASASTFATYTINDFNLQWIDRTNLGQALGTPAAYYPGAVFSFDIDGKYRIVGSRLPFLLFGTTVSTAPDGTTFSSTKTYYSVTLDLAKMTANVVIGKAQFSSGMPSMDMIFPNVPVTIDSNGIITLTSSGEITPQLTDKTPQPEFPITAVNGTIDPAKGMTLDFTCNVRKQALYTVKANVNYTDFNGLNDGL